MSPTFAVTLFGSKTRPPAWLPALTTWTVIKPPDTPDVGVPATGAVFVATPLMDIADVETVELP